MANEKEKQELVEKVSALVREKFSGDWYRAFHHYAGRGGSAIEVDKEELKELLADADVGNRLTRGAWAKAIMGEMDADGNEEISYEEFQQMLRGEELKQED